PTELTPPLVESSLGEVSLKGYDVALGRLVIGWVGVDVLLAVAAQHDQMTHRSHVGLEVCDRLSCRVRQLKPDGRLAARLGVVERYLSVEVVALDLARNVRREGRGRRCV